MGTGMEGARRADDGRGGQTMGEEGRQRCQHSRGAAREAGLSAIALSSSHSPGPPQASSREKSTRPVRQHARTKTTVSPAAQCRHEDVDTSRVEKRRGRLDQVLLCSPAPTRRVHLRPTQRRRRRGQQRQHEEDEASTKTSTRPVRQHARTKTMASPAPARGRGGQNASTARTTPARQDEEDEKGRRRRQQSRKGEGEWIEC